MGTSKSRGRGTSRSVVKICWSGAETAEAREEALNNNIMMILMNH